MSDWTKDWGCLLGGGDRPSLAGSDARPGFVEKRHGEVVCGVSLLATSLGNLLPKDLPLDVRIWAAIMMLMHP